MKLYRDLQPDEALRAGDERMSGNSREWVPVYSGSIGQPAPADLLAFYRRPVDLPTLQRVTPEAMAELEADEIRTIAVLSRGHAKTMTWKPSLRQWQSRAADSPLDWQWFIELSTIPEVQQ